MSHPPLRDTVTEPAKPTWPKLFAVAVAALVMLVAADWVAWRAAPPHYLREVQEGVEDLRHRDPQILVIGSSHARTFHVLGELLAKRTDNRVQVVSIPVEAGKLTSYRWVLEHRLRPLLEERNANGQLVRPALKRFILVTEWWDNCPPKPGEVVTNLPGRAWQWSDFMDDAIDHGLTTYNRNYLQTRWRRLWRVSSIMQDRGMGRILSAASDFATGANPDRDRDSNERFTRYWQALQESGGACMGDPAQTAALRDLLDYFHQRGTAITIVLEPRKPSTITPRALTQTFAPFTAMMDSLAQGYGASVFDLSTKTPLLDSDFAADFDHVTPEGNRKFSEWALQHDLRFLLGSADSAVGRLP